MDKESSAAASLSKTSSAGRPLLDCLVVDRVPLGCWRMCPIYVAVSIFINLLIASAVSPGHPCRHPAFAAAASTRLGKDAKLA